MEFLFTKEQKWLDKWDEFLKKENRGSHLQYSHWLQSYKSYGFDYEICVFIKNQEIIGGFGAVIAKFSFFKFYIIAYGPIVKQDNSILEKLIFKVQERAKEIKACYCQINLPFSNNPLIENHVFNNKIQLTNLKLFKSGHLFKFVFSLNGLNWLDLKQYNDPEKLLLDFKSSVRRDIRSAIRKDLTVKFLDSEKDIKAAYNLCQENALRSNYAIRDWDEFKETIFGLIKKGNAKFISANKDNEMKGAIFLIKSGNFYTYILGGTKKEKPDLLVGHFLQWEAIKLSINEKCEGYNISLGGSKGVQEFKNSFNTQNILFENGKYYKVLNSFLFSFFIFFEKYLKPYKKRIAKILAFFK